MIRVCFVCLGNICRSPLAEGVMANLVERAGLHASIAVESAGTGSWHVGQVADRRARAAAERQGLTLRGRARQFKPADFDRCDYIIALDRQNRADLLALARSDRDLAAIHVLRAFDPSADTPDVADPYYGTDEDFDQVLRVCETACAGLLKHLRERHGL